MDDPLVELRGILDFSKIPVQAVEAALAGYIPFKWLSREEMEELYPSNATEQKGSNNGQVREPL